MKKILVVPLCLTIILGLCACGNLSSNSNKNNENVNKHEQEISVEAVKNAPVTVEELFDYEEVEGGISITEYNGEEAIVVVPDVIGGNAVVKIGDNAFGNNSTIQAVRLGKNVTEIGGHAFENCKNLRIFIANDELSIINEYAFNNCESLQILQLNQKVEKLDTLCFAGLDSLQEIYIPSSAQEIEVPFVNGTEVTIITEAGSAVEKYAAEAGIKCEIR